MIFTPDDSHRGDVARGLQSFFDMCCPAFVVCITGIKHVVIAFASGLTFEYRGVIHLKLETVFLQ